MKRLIGLATASVILATSGPAIAQGYGQNQDTVRGQSEAGHRNGARMVMMLGAADLNGDNTVTRAEIAELQSQEFAFRDRNGDGFLDRDDASPTMQRVRQLRSDDAPRREGRRRGGSSPRERLAELDTNNDNRISRQEFLNRPTRLFDRLDADDNGAVTPAELDAMVAARTERRQQRNTPWWRD